MTVQSRLNDMAFLLEQDLNERDRGMLTDKYERLKETYQQSKTTTTKNELRKQRRAVRTVRGNQ